MVTDTPLLMLPGGEGRGKTLHAGGSHDLYINLSDSLLPRAIIGSGSDDCAGGLAHTPAACIPVSNSLQK